VDTNYQYFRFIGFTAVGLKSNRIIMGRGG